jgi:predicted phosphohydrolase
MKICCLADTHGFHRQLDIPACDLILHAGDITMNGELDTVTDFNNWVGELGIPFITTVGNHDKNFFRNPEALKLLPNCELLLDSSAYFNEFKIYGSPWSPQWHIDSFVFHAKRGVSIRGIWNKIPKDTDILITHSPPFGILDHVPTALESPGCKDLLEVVQKIKPKVHIFGHLHFNGGQTRYSFRTGTTFVNAAICNEKYPAKGIINKYKPTNKIITINI